MTNIESLECRRLLATVGPLVAQHFVGTPEGITSVVLTFDVPLDPTTASNSDAYSLVKKFRSDKDDEGFGGGFGGGLFGGDDGHESRSSRVPIASATYDATANTVTLVPRNVFTLRQSFTVIVARGKGENTIMTAAGTPLDGDGNGRPGGDVTLRFKAGAKRSMSFREADGDRAKIRLEGDGRFLYFLPIRGRSSPSIFLRDTNVAGSVLSATVKKGKRGDGVIDLAQLSGASTAQVQFQNDPAFRIRAVVP
jgi:hypothetical protein